MLGASIRTLMGHMEQQLLTRETQQALVPETSRTELPMRECITRTVGPIHDMTTNTFPIFTMLTERGPAIYLSQIERAFQAILERPLGRS